MDYRGKQFETKFKQDFLKTVPNSTIDRLYDTMNGYRTITQVSDYIGYSKPFIFYLELKTHKGASIPLANITQFDKLSAKVGIPGVRAGVILWLYEKDWIGYIPVKTLQQLKEKGVKSVGLKAEEEGYKIIRIPSVKKKVFMDSDYSILMSLEDSD